MFDSNSRRGGSKPARNDPNIRRWIGVSVRIVIVIVGGYVLTAEVVAAFAGVVTLLGFHRSEAVLLASMSGFIGYLLVLLWGFSESRILRICLYLGVFSGIAHLVTCSVKSYTGVGA